MKQADNIRKQLRNYMENLGVTIMSCGTNTEPIRRAIASAFFLQAAVRQEDGSYKTLLGNKIVSVHPSSVLFTKKPACVIYNQLVYTKRKYMRDVMLIPLRWLHELAPHFWQLKEASND